MLTELFRPHMVGAIVFYFWAMLIFPLHADTPPFWFDFSAKLMDHPINSEPDEPFPGQSAEKPFNGITHHGGILLVPEQGDSYNEFKLRFQGVLTDNLESEIDGTLEYSYDLINYETSINVKTSRPLLVSYDNRKAKIIQLTGKGHILTNSSPIQKHDLYHTQKKVFDELSKLGIAHVDRLPCINEWQVYMMSSSGDDRKGSDNRKRVPDKTKQKESKKRNEVELCSRCNTQRYVVKTNIWPAHQGHACFYYGMYFFLHAFSGAAPDCSACPWHAFPFTDYYPTCSFYAELDTENSDRPAVNRDLSEVLAAITQWSNNQSGHSGSQNEAQPQPGAPQQNTDPARLLVSELLQALIHAGHRTQLEPEALQQDPAAPLDEQHSRQEDTFGKPD